MNTTIVRLIDAKGSLFRKNVNAVDDMLIDSFFNELGVKWREASDIEKEYETDQPYTYSVANGLMAVKVVTLDSEVTIDIPKRCTQQLLTVVFDGAKAYFFGRLDVKDEYKLFNMTDLTRDDMSVRLTLAVRELREKGTTNELENRLNNGAISDENLKAGLDGKLETVCKLISREFFKGDVSIPVEQLQRCLGASDDKGGAAVEELKAQVEALNKELSDMEEENSDLRKKLMAAGNNAGGNSEQIESFKNKIKELSNEKAGLQDKLDMATAKIEELKKQVDNLDGVEIRKARDLLSLVEDSEFAEVSYVGVMGTELMQNATLEEFIGNALQHLFKAKGLEASPYIFDGDRFKCVKATDNQKPDMILNNTGYMIDLQGKTDMEALNTLRVLFSSFPEIIFLCKKIGRVQKGTTEPTAPVEELPVAGSDFSDEDDEALDFGDDTPDDVYEPSEKKGADQVEEIGEDGLDFGDDTPDDVYSPTEKPEDGLDFGDDTPDDVYSPDESTEDGLDFGDDTPDDVYSPNENEGEALDFGDDTPDDVYSPNEGEKPEDDFSGDDADFADEQNEDFEDNGEDFQDAGEDFQDDDDFADEQGDFADEQGDFADEQGEEDYSDEESDGDDFSDVGYADEEPEDDEEYYEDENGDEGDFESEGDGEEYYEDENGESYDENGEAYEDEGEDFDEPVEGLEEFDQDFGEETEEEDDGIYYVSIPVSDFVGDIGIDEIYGLHFATIDGTVYDINAREENIENSRLLVRIIAAMLAAEVVNGRYTAVRELKKLELTSIDNHFQPYSDSMKGFMRVLNTSYGVGNISSIVDLVEVVDAVSRALRIDTSRILLGMEVHIADASKTQEDWYTDRDELIRTIESYITAYPSGAETRNIGVILTGNNLYKNITMTSKALKVHQTIISRLIAVKYTANGIFKIGSRQDFADLIYQFTSNALTEGKIKKPEDIGMVLGRSGCYIISTDRNKVAEGIKVEGVGTETMWVCGDMEEYEKVNAVVAAFGAYSTSNIAMSVSIDKTALEFYYKRFKTADPFLELATSSFVAFVINSMQDNRKK